MHKTTRAETPYDPDIVERPGWEGLQVHWLADRDNGGTETSVFIESVFPPQCAHELHRHPHGEEYFYVLEGKGYHLTEGEPVPLAPGDMVFVPKNEWHGFANPNDEPVRVITVIGGVSHYTDGGYETAPEQPEIVKSFARG